MDSQRTKLENTAAALKARYNSAMRGRMVPSSQAMRILKEMDAVQKQIKALDQDAAERLALGKAPIDEMLAITDLTAISGGYTHVRFRRGYTNTTMTFKCESITIGKGNPDWGAPEEKVFIIKLGERV